MKRLVFFMGIVLLSMSVFPATAQPERGRRARNPVAVERLEAETAAAVSLNPATGTTRFVRFPKGFAVQPRARSRATAAGQDRHQRSLALLREYAGAFGLREDPASSLRLESETGDDLGGRHLTYAQTYRNLPVFGGRVRTHFDADGNISAVSGTLVPDIAVDPKPSLSRDAISGAALAAVSDLGRSDLAVRGMRLLVFRTGLIQGVEGQNHLAWEVEIGNGNDVRELLYVNAHSSKLLDRIRGIQDALNRRAYNTTANFPNTPFWVEGDAFPTADPEANNVIQ
ncbi:MAG TPA: hypothetical protein VIG29_12725, partial [Vicinamibacteria bacterium]